ncbi:MAG TPA: hypothetical protein VHS28_00085 [Chloroflexota bacterium]|nr:hypothetical protein [Chloroflexota bacterium]
MKMKAILGGSSLGSLVTAAASQSATVLLVVASALVVIALTFVFAVLGNDRRAGHLLALVKATRTPAEPTTKPTKPGKAPK